MKKEKIRNISAWVLQVILGLMFLMAGSSKFQHASVWERKFQNWGFPDHYYIIIGILEMIGAIGLFIPRFMKPAAIFLITIMIGAAATHLFNNEASEIMRPGMFLILLPVLLYLRKSD